MRRARGFTLVEVIIATALLAMGLALAFSSLRGAGRATAHAEQAAQREERLRAVQGLLRTQIGTAMPVAFEFNAETGEATFLRLGRNKLEFVSTLPGYLSRGGPYLQTLELQPGPRGLRLVYQHQLLSTEGPLKPEREPVVLLEDIADARFEVRGVDENSRLTPWVGEWKASASLPPLLRLRLVFADKQQQWPDLVVAPRLSVAYTAGNDPLAAGGER
jgi:general secretion pathway protein J